MQEDTITAISTPPGEGGIGIVRLSGKDAVQVVQEIFKSKNGKVLSEVHSHTISYGHIMSSGEIIDEVLVTVMRGPCTYTREDIVEINCHGGIVPLKRVLELVIKKGARLAEPGEFTKRAYLNGRIDLTQAEAVADIIRAKTNASYKAALSQLNGSIYSKVEDISEVLRTILVQMEAAIDFSGEGVMPPSHKDIQKKLMVLIDEINTLKSTADKGLVLREGLTMSIVGRPNVGKSTLFNALLGRDRVIVTSVPGTTRDVVEEIVDIGGLPVRMADTAGIIKDSTDLIEQEGVERSLQWLSRADLIIAVVDGSEPLTEADKHLLEDLKGRRTVVLVNKCDLPVRIELDQVKKVSGKDGLLMISAKGGEGISELEKRIVDTVWGGEVGSRGEPIITNIRHLDALQRASDSLKKAVEGIGEMGEEILAFDLRKGLDSLGEIVGKVTREDILNGIFSEFCIGK